MSFWGKRQIEETSSEKNIKEKLWNWCKNTFCSVTSSVTFWTIVGSILILIACSYYYHFSVFYNFKEIGYKQQQEDLKTEFVQFHNDLGYRLLCAEKIDAAKNEFNQVLQVDPINQKAKTGLSECELYSSASNVSIDPEITEMKLYALLPKNSSDPSSDPLPFLYLGKLAISTNDSKRALSLFNESINISPTLTAAYIEKGNIFDKMGQTDMAIEMYQRAINRSNHTNKDNYRSDLDIIAQNNLVYVYYEIKDYQNATNLSAPLCMKRSNFLLSYYYLSHSFRLMGDLNSASDYQQKLIGNLMDDSITNMPLNQGKWRFPKSSTDSVYMSNLSQKKYYAYYDMALTCYLLGDKEVAAWYVNKANELQIDTNLILDVIEVSNFDMTTLKETQPKYETKISEFKKFIHIKHDPRYSAHKLTVTIT